MDYLEEVHVEAELNPGSIEEWLSIIQEGKKIERGTRRSDLSTKVKRHLSALGWVLWYAYKGKRREMRYKSPNGKWFYSLATACMYCVDQNSREHREKKEVLLDSVVSCSPSKRNRVKEEEDTCSVFDVSRQQKRKKGCDTAAFKGEEGSSNCMSCVDQQQEQQIVPKSVLPCVTRKLDVLDQKRNKDSDTAASNDKNLCSSGYIKISLNIEISKQKQRKRRKKCDARFSSLPPKEDKGDEKKPNSLKNILDVMEKKNETEEKESLRFLRKDSSPDMNCDVCCVCHSGGDLLLCDGCPSSFHYTCIGLSNLPEEDLWFCPCCCCYICGSMESQENSKLMACEQCQKRHHLKCLKEVPCLVSPRGWFCSSQCSKVFTSLENLLGRKIPLDEDLVWRLIRAPNGGEHYNNEQLSKLNSAVEILHQGFMPSKDLITGEDLVEELVFKRDDNGIGRGFYMVLVERKNQPITVAAIRVDKEAAEIPLVSTLSDYRTSGMCRVLMDELEKQLSRIGVGRLVLPAATEALTTWTERFGFSVMESKERLELVKHGMFDFLGTVMCHKFLVRREDDHSSLTT